MINEEFDISANEKVTKFGELPIKKAYVAEATSVSGSMNAKSVALQVWSWNVKFISRGT